MNLAFNCIFCISLEFVEVFVLVMYRNEFNVKFVLRAEVLQLVTNREVFASNFQTQGGG